MKEGLLPGCVEACPVDALTFGRRSDLIKIARSRMRENPGLYVNYIYGEHDAGGTAWMVLAPAAGAQPGPEDDPPVTGHEMTQLGLDPELGNQPMAELTYGALGSVPMIVAFWPVLFGGAYAITKAREARNREDTENALRKTEEEMRAAMEAALDKIAKTQGQEAADQARKMMEDAMAAKKAEINGEEK